MTAALSQPWPPGSSSIGRLPCTDINDFGADPDFGSTDKMAALTLARSGTRTLKLEQPIFAIRGSTTPTSPALRTC